MLNFFKKKATAWAAKQHREQLQYFIDMLRGANMPTLATVVATSVHAKNTYLKSDAFLEAQGKALDSFFLTQTCQHLQTLAVPNLASGLEVWLHTNRAHYELSNRFLVKEMWALLLPAFPYALEASEYLSSRYSINLDMTDPDKIPDEYSWIFN